MVPVVGTPGLEPRTLPTFSRDALNQLKRKKPPTLRKWFLLWEHLGSNQGPPACKAGALNQLSYAPFISIFLTFQALQNDCHSE